MQTYVWGILLSAFLLDILKNSLNTVGENSSNSTEEKFDDNTQKENSGIKVKLDNNEELKVKYEGEIQVNKLNTNNVIKIQYCTS
jgi:hypothetical protein